MKPALKYTLIGGGILLGLFGAVVIYNHYKKQPAEKTTAQKIADTITTLSKADWSFVNNLIKTTSSGTKDTGTTVPGTTDNGELIS
jgi:hypothetical protein